MLGLLRRAEYSHRAWLVAVFVACAMLLGGGGTPSPRNEIILQVVFAVLALGWLWLGKRDAEPVKVDTLVFPLMGVLLIVPFIQLVPLPPSVWQVLPGRGDQEAALELVDAAASWRPIALSPTRTLASLLAMIPPVLCIYAVAALKPAERRLVLLSIVVMAVAGGMLGMVQLLAGNEGINFYRVFHRGWVTGFQANRNAQADIFLIALLALAALARGRAGGQDGRAPGPPRGRPVEITAAAVGVFFLAALLLTGSRAGISIALPALAVAGLMLVPSLDTSKPASIGSLAIVAMVPLFVAVMVGITVLVGSRPVARALSRFEDLEANRLEIWQDTMFAISQYWPVGVGTGGFPPTILAAERLEFVGRTFPNRAHNEYLEMGLESGVFGYLAVAAAVAITVAMAFRSWRQVPGMRRQVLFGLGTLIVIGLHSAVDYPLRSMSLATLAGVAAGMVARLRRGETASGAITGPSEVSRVTL